MIVLFSEVLIFLMKFEMISLIFYSFINILCCKTYFSINTN
jgi:hypothetical protein